MENHKKPLEQRVGMGTLIIEDPTTGRTYTGEGIKPYLVGKTEEIVWISNMGQFNDFYAARARAMNAIIHTQKKSTEAGNVELAKQVSEFSVMVRHYSFYKDIFQKGLNRRGDELERALTDASFYLGENEYLAPPVEDIKRLVVWGGREVIRAAYEMPLEKFKRVIAGYAHNLGRTEKVVGRKSEKSEEEKKIIEFMADLKGHVKSYSENDPDQTTEQFLAEVATRLDSIEDRDEALGSKKLSQEYLQMCKERAKRDNRDQ